jgi:hypothetical protein
VTRPPCPGPEVDRLVYLSSPLSCSQQVDLIFFFFSVPPFYFYYVTSKILLVRCFVVLFTAAT